MKLVCAEGAGSGRRGVILISEFTDVPLPIETAQGRFARTRERLAKLASAAEEDGEALLLQIGPTWGGGRLSREVEVNIGSTHERGDAQVVPLDWRSTDLTGMFPVLSGDLELAPLGANSCRLTLAASYIPPLGDIGRALDHALLHRVAQSTVRSFLARVASSLEEDEGREPAVVTT